MKNRQDNELYFAQKIIQIKEQNELIYADLQDIIASLQSEFLNYRVTWGNLFELYNKLYIVCNRLGDSIGRESDTGAIMELIQIVKQFKKELDIE